MKKIIAGLVAAAMVSFAAFAEDEEGLSVSGYLRAGVTDTTEDSVLTADTWQHGGYFGGKTRLRVNVDYTKAFGGVTFRYQQTEKLNDFFNSENIKWAMGFANFFDGQVIAEAGIITDRFTTTGGWEDAGIDDGNGFRLVFVPKAVEGLTLAVQATDNRDFVETETVKDENGNDVENVKFNEKALGASAKYENDAFFVTAGAAFAGYYYGSVGLKAVENLSFVVEAFYDNTDATKGDHNDKATTMIVPWVEYTGIEKLLLGAYSYINLCDGEYEIEITPAVAYDLNDLLKLSAESSIYLSSNDNVDPYATISPAVTFKASDKATASVSALISTDTKKADHAVSAGVCYKF